MVDGEDIRAVANLLNLNTQLIVVTDIEMFSLVLYHHDAVYGRERQDKES